MTLTWSGADVDDSRLVRGLVVADGEPGFDESRAVWNAMIDRRPLAVVRAAAVADVAPTIGFARRHGLDLAIRGGGHNVAGNGTVGGGIVLDLGDLTDVTVDPANRAVRVQAGATLRHIDAATQPHGLVVPIGVVSGTGIAGLTLGGGVGWLTRMYGLSCDNLLQVELVTADGDPVVASEAEHPDLFWALKGGGGNFGVVTAFTFRAYPLGPQVFAGNLVYGVDKWRTAWRALAAWTRDLPDAMTTITTTTTPPPIMEMGDQPLLMVGFAWASQDRPPGEALADQLRQAAPPDVEEVGDVAWTAWQAAFDPLVPKGVRAYWRNTSRPARRQPHRRPRPPRTGADLDRHRVRRAPHGRRVRTDPRRRHSVPESGRAVLDQHLRILDRPGRRRRADRVRARPVRRPRAVRLRRAVRQLPRPRARRTPHPGPEGNLRAGQVRPLGRGQAPPRPGQPVPHQPQHPPGIADAHDSEVAWMRHSAA